MPNWHASTAPPPRTPAVRRLHRWACTVYAGTKREKVVMAYGGDRESAREKVANAARAPLDDVLVRYVSTAAAD